jgi:hypothetical protein
MALYPWQIPMEIDTEWAQKAARAWNKPALLSRTAQKGARIDGLRRPTGRQKGIARRLDLDRRSPIVSSFASRKLSVIAA